MNGIFPEVQGEEGERFPTLEQLLSITPRMGKALTCREVMLLDTVSAS